MKNRYEIRGDVTAIFIDSPKYGVIETLISTCKIEKVMNEYQTVNVSFDKKSRKIYVSGKQKIKTGNYITVHMHRFLTDAPKGMVVDHYDNNTLNNTDKNLKIATVSQNAQNRKGAQANNKAGIRGVHWSKHHNRWVAVIYVNRKRIEVGYFSDLEEAVKAVEESRKKHMPYIKNKSEETK